jgi:hypothetical protein
MRGWFDLFRDNGGPTLYAYSNRTSVVGDVQVRKWINNDNNNKNNTHLSDLKCTYLQEWQLIVNYSYNLESEVRSVFFNFFVVAEPKMPKKHLAEPQCGQITPSLA